VALPGGRPSGGAPTYPLTAAIAEGDERAFGAFYEAWFDRTFALARSISRRDEAFCLDVVQDAMLRVVRAMKPLPDEAAVTHWMGRVVFTTALDHLRGEARRRKREERVGAEAAAAAARDGHGGGGGEDAGREREDRLRWLEEQLEELSGADRLLMDERFRRGRTLEAAGAAAGITGNAAHGRLRRIIERLRSAARTTFHE
jgi:RNA polymerase sigma factor (sigma-70 family)